ncbi:MAG: transcriptional repressor [Pseudomonadales bacterium]|nr:transcriptional repressor [Pseudomonadales bacterium]
MARVAIIPKEIIELLSSSHILSAFQILEMLKIKGNKYNKTSVYRALEKLLVEGKICKQNFGNDEFKYELRKQHHDHAICDKCKKVISVKCHDRWPKKVSGFTIDHHHSTLYGLCKDCSK